MSNKVTRTTVSPINSIICDLGGRASDFRSRGPGFKTTTHLLCLCLLEEKLKAIGPVYLVSMPGEAKDPTQGVNVQPAVDSTSYEPLQKHS